MGGFDRQRVVALAQRLETALTASPNRAEADSVRDGLSKLFEAITAGKVSAALDRVPVDREFMDGPLSQERELSTIYVAFAHAVTGHDTELAGAEAKLSPVFRGQSTPYIPNISEAK